MDEKFVTETPAIDRQRQCLKCSQRFNQLYKDQDICHNCISEEEAFDNMIDGQIEESRMEKIKERQREINN